MCVYECPGRVKVFILTYTQQRAEIHMKMGVAMMSLSCFGSHDSEIIAIMKKSRDESADVEFGGTTIR